MQDPYLGEIMTFAGNFAPQGFVPCDGRLMSISQYSALFSILGTTYGGDGRTTFGVPDLRGRAIVSNGAGPGLSPRTIGELGGSENVTLISSQLPPHVHSMPTQPVAINGSIPKANVSIASTSSVKCAASGTSSSNPQGCYPGDGGATIYNGSHDAQMASDMVTTTSTVSSDIAFTANASLSGQTGVTGGGAPVSTMPPFLCIIYCMAFEGLYPSRP